MKQQPKRTTKEITVSYKEQAINRVIDLLDRHTYERPADILADLMHFCDSQQGVDNGSETFDEELRVAYRYVEDELAEDAELASGEDEQ